MAGVEVGEKQLDTPVHLAIRSSLAAHSHCSVQSEAEAEAEEAGQVLLGW